MNFPDGVPCVSDASMSRYMEYVYMQQPIPTDTTGVPIVLNVVDANGNYRTIGTTTSDSTGLYSYTWTPDIAGEFKIYATFPGTESYYPSQASTAFYAAQAAPQATAAPVENNQSAADLYFIPAVIGLFIVIIAVGLLIILVLRKK